MKLTRWLLPVLSLGWPGVALAQIRNLPDSFCALGLPCQGHIVDYVIWIINVLLTLVGLVAVVMVIYGGVKYITTMGDEQAAEEAKSVILYAVIGLIIIGLSAAIVNFVVLAIRGVVLE